MGSEMCIRDRRMVVVVRQRRRWHCGAIRDKQIKRAPADHWRSSANQQANAIWLLEARLRTRCLGVVTGYGEPPLKPLSKQGTRKETMAQFTKAASHAGYLHQRQLHFTQACYPTTGSTEQFCLFCCQPEPVPASLSTGASQLTLCCPCRVLSWSGQAIHMSCRA